MRKGDAIVPASEYGTVKKANRLIQESKFSLTRTQQRVIALLISMISPMDEEFKECTFTISEFCMLCGIDEKNGKNHKNIKDALKTLRDQSVWIRDEEQQEIRMLSWIENPTIGLRTGIVKVKLHSSMAPFLLQLRNNFTSYQLRWTMRFKSTYSQRLYEYLQSVHFDKAQPYTHTITLTALKERLDAENYTDYRNFRRNVLEPAIAEINQYSDKTVSYTSQTAGRTVIGIIFEVTNKSREEQLNMLMQYARTQFGTADNLLPGGTKEDVFGDIV